MNNSTIKYIVSHADWDIDCPENIDDRTIRHREFDSKEKAIAYANDYLEKDKENEFSWIAYLEIKECVTTLIQKLR